MSSELRLSKNEYGTIIIGNPNTDIISLRVSLEDQSDSNTKELLSGLKKTVEKKTYDKLNINNTNYDNTEEAFPNIPKKNKKKIFISYVKKDLYIGKRLYNDFKRYPDIEPWLAKDDLKVGQKIEININKQIKEAEHFLVLLSCNSVNKKGFFTKEVNIALDRLNEFPNEYSFIIPVYLNDCKYDDERLTNLRGVYLFSSSYEESLQQILRAIGVQPGQDSIPEYQKDQEEPKNNRPKER